MLREAPAHGSHNEIPIKFVIVPSGLQTSPPQDYLPVMITKEDTCAVYPQYGPVRLRPEMVAKIP